MLELIVIIIVCRLAAGALICVLSRIIKRKNIFYSSSLARNVNENRGVA